MAPGKWIREIIAGGYRIEFTDTPPATTVPRLHSVPTGRGGGGGAIDQTILAEVSILLAKGAIRKINPPFTGGFWSTVFCTPKKDRWVASNPEPQAVESIHQAAEVQDGYPSIHSTVPLEGEMGVGNRSPRRLSACPGSRVRPTLAQVPTAGSELCMDMPTVRPLHFPSGVHDDHPGGGGLPQAEGGQPLYVSRRLVGVRSLSGRDAPTHSAGSRDATGPGFLDQLREIQLDPSQDLKYLGASLRLDLGLATPSLERAQVLVTRAITLSKGDSAPASAWNSLLGIMSSMVDLVPYCRFHMRLLQLHLGMYFRPSVHPDSRRVPMTGPMREELAWWTSMSNLMRGMQFPAPSVEIIMTTDASLSGWGGHLLESRVSGTWSIVESRAHINLLELWAVEKTLGWFELRVMGRNILVQTDNSTVVAYVNRQGARDRVPSASMPCVSLPGAETGASFCLQFTYLG